MNSRLTLFLLTLLLVFLVQINYFNQFSFGDNDKWVRRVQNLTNDLLRRPIHIDLMDDAGEFRFSAHPGTSFLLPAAIAHRLGATPRQSLITTIAFLNSALIAFLVIVCFNLRPHSLWWVTTGIILAVHPLYFYSTPTNVLIGPTIALLSLLALAIYENKDKDNLRFYTISFAAVAGFSLSNRLPVTVVIVAPLLAFISSYVKAKQVLLIILITGLTSFILNPLLWLIPVEFISTIILRTASHVVYAGLPGINYSPLHFIYYSPLTLIGFMFIAVLMFLPSYKPPISRPFLLTILLITGTVVAIMAGSSYKTLRYLYPVIFTWDILFPLFLLDATERFSFSFITSQPAKNKATSIAKIFIIIILTSGFAFLTFYNLSLPGSQGII